MAFVRFKRNNKFNSQIIHRDNRKFHSKLEGAVYDILLMRQKQGEIATIECQKKIEFRIKETKILGYIPDFKCTTTEGELFFVEAKGKGVDALWPVKRKLWLVCGPAPLEVFMGDYRKPFLEEIINPL